jgi:hypothetical protein
MKHSLTIGFIIDKKVIINKMKNSLETRIRYSNRIFLYNKGTSQSVMSGLSAKRMERRNRSVHRVHENFEHHQTKQSGRVISF